MTDAPRYALVMSRKKKRSFTTTRVDKETLEIIRQLQADWEGTVRGVLAMNQADILRLLVKHGASEIAAGRTTLKKLALDDIQESETDG